MPSAVRRIFGILLTGFLLLPAGWLFAVGTNVVCVSRSWQSSDGLPDNSVVSVAQTPDGYLWVATAGGLMRFDGARLQEFPLANIDGIPNRVVRAMICDRRGWLWLEMDRGPIVCISPSETRVFTNTPDAFATFMANDADGSIWVTYTDGGLTRIKNGQITIFDSTSGWPANGASSLTTDVNGELWFAKGNQIGIFRDGKFQTLMTWQNDISCIGQRREGGIWFCAGRRLWQFSEGDRPRRHGQFPERGGRVQAQAILEDNKGAIWVGTAADGLFRFLGTNAVVVPTSYLEITCLALDREGNIWAGTSGGGLDRVRPRVIELLGRDSGLPNESIRSVCEDSKGVIWVATWNGLLAQWQHGMWTTLVNGTNSPEGVFSCVAADPDGGVWIGTRDNGFFHLKNGRCKHWVQRDGLSSDDVRAILQSSSGDVFISTDLPSRLQRLDETGLQPLEMPVQPRSIRGLVEDANKTIWAGSADGLLMRVHGDQLIDETPGATNRLMSIRCLLPTPDGSLWIGYAGWGIGRLKNGKFVRITTAQGLYDDYVSQMVLDDQGGLWCAGNRGIFQVQLARLSAVADGRADRLRSIVYGQNEGFANLQPNFENVSGAFRGHDGRLFFPMRTGLVIIHPENVPQNSAPPPVILERVAVDGQTVALYDRRLAVNSENSAAIVNLPSSPTSRSILKFPPEHRKLDFEFTALSFTAPENIQFQYRLENFDENWVEAGNQRSASYSRLPPGKYRFDVRACNNNGPWSPVATSLDFVVKPFYWQTWWFRLIALLLFVFSVIAIVHYVSVRRLREQLAVMEQQAALQHERARIAKDIHDDLGANLTQIAFLGELAQQDRGEPQKAAERVEKISATARQAIKSLDEIVWAVNPRNDTLAHLMDYAGQFALDYLRLAGIRCRLDFPDEFPERELSTDLRHNLFLVIKEALHNVVKHAQASEVWLRINYSPTALDVTIEDNGRGFEHHLTGNGDMDDALADGLRNMRSRMSEIGGKFEFESHAGLGTKILLHLPMQPLPSLA